MPHPQAAFLRTTIALLRAGDGQGRGREHTHEQQNQQDSGGQTMHGFALRPSQSSDH